MNRFIFTAIILLFTFEIHTEKTKRNEKPDLHRIVLWEGDITGVYKDSSKVKVYLKHNPEYLGINFKEIKSNILSKKDFEIRQKVTNKLIGYFVPQQVELEKKIEKKNKTDFEVMIFGKLVPQKNSFLELISNDFTISLVRYEEAYLDPSAFFSDSYIGPKEKMISFIDKKEMVLIPSGFFIYGQAVDGEKDNFNPSIINPDESNMMELPSFYIDKYEVTNSEYEKFLRETNTKAPSHWESGVMPAGKDSHPVINLTYREVEKYASWVGKRLPTEFEWEKAARGSGFEKNLNRDETYTIKLKTRKFPFGNKFEGMFCNTKESKIMDTVSVYELSIKGASPYGVIGMCGNAPEWTSSWYLPYLGHEIENSSYGKQYKVIRGGSFFEERKKATTYYRNFGGNPNLQSDRRAGFRLVKDL